MMVSDKHGLTAPAQGALLKAARQKAGQKQAKNWTPLTSYCRLANKKHSQSQPQDK